MKRILIIEDEPSIASLLADYLKATGFTVEIRDNGLDGLACARRGDFDLLLLDLMLPGLDGTEVCRKIREQSSVPIIMITARVEEADRLTGLDLGADDYICKPFSPREVVARVQAVLRRTTKSVAPRANTLRVASESLTVQKDKVSVQLTVIEFRILEYLRKWPDQVLSRGQIMVAAYEDGRVVSDRTVDSHIKKLRLKLSKLNLEKEPIHSIYSMGYKWSE